jgi:hypothetical protein
MVDVFSPRYFLVKHDKNIVAWNIDTDTKMTFQIPDEQTDEQYRTIIPYFSNQKYGMLTYNNKNSIIYAIYSANNNKNTKNFESDEQYFNYHLLRVNNKNCIALVKRDLTYDIRTVDAWQILNKGSKNVLRELVNIDSRGIAIDHLTERFYIESIISPREVHIWDCVNKKRITSFDGSCVGIKNAVDNSGEYGVFSMFIDSLSSQGKLKKTSNVQIINLQSGKMQSQIIYDSPTGACFSPIDSRVLLLWSNSNKNAIIWKSPMFYGVETGEIMARLKLPSDYTKNQQDIDNDIVYGTFSSDGKKIVFITEALNVYIYSAATGKYLKNISISPLLPNVIKYQQIKPNIFKHQKFYKRTSTTNSNKLKSVQINGQVQAKLARGCASEISA